MVSGKRILVLAPHTDDGELGCGGTIARLAPSNEIYYVAFSSCSQSVPAGFTEDVLKHEMKDATKILGLKDQNIILKDYEVRRFSYQRQEILDDLIKIKKDLSPGLVFMPSATDIHQDHFTITSEAIRAFKYSSILSYEIPWNNIVFKSGSYSTLSEDDLAKKCEAVAVYKSQAHREYTRPDFITSLAKVRGLQIGQTYAEAFEVVRWIL